MSAQAQLLFERSAEAYRNLDGELAASIDQLDDVLDDLHYLYIETLLQEARRHDLLPQQSLQFALIGRFYERIGDHATNIAETVHYQITGITLTDERPKGDMSTTEPVELPKAGR